MSVWRCLNQQCSSSTFRLASSTSRSIQARSFSSAARQSNSPFSFALWQGCNEASWRRRRPDLETRNMPRGRRRFATTPVVQHGHLDPPKPGEELNVTFIDKDGERHDFQVAKGDNLLDIAQANDLEMEGACGGSCACSTCHVIVEDPDMYDKMPEPDDDENDMLDLAFGLTETSRLGCQIKMTPELDGLVVKLPSMTRNMQASDFTEKKKS